MRWLDHIRSKDAKRLDFGIGDTFVLEAAQAAPGGGQRTDTIV
jgi:hypothetical protein